MQNIGQSQQQPIITEKNLTESFFAPEPNKPGCTQLRRIHKQAIVFAKKIIAITPDTGARQTALYHLQISTKEAMKAVMLGNLS